MLRSRAVRLVAAPPRDDLRRVFPAPRWPDRWREDDRLLVSPIIGRVEAHGLIGIVRPADAPLTQEQRTLVATVAAQISAALEAAERFRLAEERRRDSEQRRKIAEGLRDIVAVLNSDRPLPQILTHIVGEAVSLLRAASGGVFFRDPANLTHYTLVATHGNLTVPEGVESLLERALRSPRALVPLVGGSQANPV